MQLCEGIIHARFVEGVGCWRSGTESVDLREVKIHHHHIFNPSQSRVRHYIVQRVRTLHILSYIYYRHNFY